MTTRSRSYVRQVLDKVFGAICRNGLTFVKVSTEYFENVRLFRDSECHPDAPDDRELQTAVKRHLKILGDSLGDLGR